MRSLVRTRSSRRGERSKAIWSSALRPSALPSRVAATSTAQFPACRFAGGGLDELGHRPRAEIARRPAAHRHGALRHLAVAHDQHVGDLLQLGLSDLIANLLHALVEFHPKPGAASGSRTVRAYSRWRSAIGSTTAWTGASHSGQAPAKCSMSMRHEALEAAENGPVDDDRPVLGVVGPDVLQVEPLRQLVVELNRGALPLPADGVGDVEVDLRAVERAVALVDGVRLAEPVERAFSSASAWFQVSMLPRNSGGRVDSFISGVSPKSP